MSTVPNSTNLINSLREAVASRAQVHFKSATVEYFGHIVELAEHGSGRSTKIENALFLPEEYDAEIESIKETEGILSFHTNSGFLEFSVIATFTESAIPIIKLENFKTLKAQEDRRSSRTLINNNPISFVTLSGQKIHQIGTFELKDVAVKAVGGILRVTNEIEDLPLIVSGRISAGSSTIRLRKAEVFRAKLLSGSKSKFFEYKVAINIEHVTSNKESQKDRRLFKRQSHARFDLIEIQSSLFPTTRIQLRVTDLSIIGLCGQLVEHLDESLLPGGCEVTFSDIRGEVISNIDGLIRIKWMLDSDSAHKSWQAALAKFSEKSNNLRSYESQSILTLLARSGIKNSSYVISFQTARDILPTFGEIEKTGDPIVYRAVQRDSDGRLLAHIGSFKIADNLWFNGDLFSSNDGKANSTKEFVKEYFQNFIEFARASRPRPKVISSWTKGHPYWRSLEDALFKEKSELLIAKASIHTVLPDIRTVFEKDSNQFLIQEINQNDIKEINDLISDADNSGLTPFLKAFDFDHDRFGSPLLRMSLDRVGYRLLRSYLKVSDATNTYIAVISRMPEGLSPQRHQSAVWIFCIKGTPDSGSVKRLVNSVILFATEISTFPSIIRIVGRDLSRLEGKECLLVLAEPTMWEYAT